MAQEKRRFERTEFTGENSIPGIFIMEDCPEEIHKAAIMDLSLGGMGILFYQDMSECLKKGDVIRLSEIRGISSLAFMKDIKMKVRWISLQSSDRFAAGCEFQELPEDIKEKLKTAMASWKIRLIHIPAD
ncbi:MAG: PilZ domain-containing protein [Desulfococcaceae bacterium]|jgi:c-di-GMP-binding flagellar brake protein YcgR|nr:PilZ domain-containing protein [Desulfococcaceae bacterium]